ncbi:MAG: HAD-superfamily hydrolase, subfamily variant 3 [Candidatus Saccharibacteria bacterium]|nr:HAD-superfamily hydrolase, subfamily variant 3 [Candidatus Saccharibacteria bacterium]MDB5180572.1 HAD-superfamily hydrolase, subfamily variant 3 [Candidatus Saccharibacteria bacterium]
MILLLDTSTPECRLTFIDGDWHYETKWEANRELAKGLLLYIQTELEGQGKTWTSITGLGVFKGPGSFTGLRIGITVLNTVAYAQSIPIVGEDGEDWREKAVQRLLSGESDSIVLPEYGGEANITQPRK